MNKIELKDGTSVDIEVRSATKNDLVYLVQLNQKFQKSILGNKIQDGYVGAAFSTETFLELINRNQIVVTQFQQRLVGYYLLNNFSKDGVIGKHEDIVNELKSKQKIAKELSICVGAQAIVDNEFMGSGIRPLMLQRLAQNVQGKFDYLFATIAKDNPRAFKAHTRDGWEVVDEDNILYFVVYKLKMI